MPFIINVGVSRKSSKDYQSTGYSLNLTAELDSALLADSNRLQNEIERIYGQDRGSGTQSIFETYGIGRLNAKICVG